MCFVLYYEGVHIVYKYHLNNLRLGNTVYIMITLFTLS